MNRTLTRALAVATSIFCVQPHATFGAQASGGEARVRMARLGLTVKDVDSVDRDLAASYRDLSGIWKTIFTQNQLTHHDPLFKRYLTDGVARCGNETLKTGNAYYCPDNDTIWYDPIFLAAIKKEFKERTQQNADNVPVLIIAHEWGHAIAFRLGFGRIYVGSGAENDADCYAGVAIRELIKSKQLPATARDQADALYRMIAVPESKETETLSYQFFKVHGTAPERHLSFMMGADSGAQSCRQVKTYYEILRKVTEPTNPAIESSPR